MLPKSFGWSKYSQLTPLLKSVNHQTLSAKISPVVVFIAAIIEILYKKGWNLHHRLLHGPLPSPSPSTPFRPPASHLLSVHRLPPLSPLAPLPNLLYRPPLPGLLYRLAFTQIGVTDKHSQDRGCYMFHINRKLEKFFLTNFCKSALNCLHIKFPLIV